MASSLKNLSQYKAKDVPNAEGMRFGIVVTDYHTDITYKMLESCTETLLKHGAKDKDIYVAHVSGAYELPLGARLLHDSKELDAMICFGCVIKGETQHDEYINQAVSQGLMHLGIQYAKPFVFGVLTPNTHEQAVARAGGKHGNKGIEAAITAIQMVDLKERLDPLSSNFVND